MRIGIVGLGLIGGSLGAALRRSGHRVMGYDVDPAVMSMARDRGLVDETCDLSSVTGQSEVVVLAVPPRATIQAISEIAAFMQPNAILTDVCSVKRAVIGAMDELPDSSRAVGGHPVAGKATGGPANADPDLFKGAPYAVVPAKRSDRESIEVIVDLARDAGAKPVVIDAESHDMQVARTSHLPQILSSALSLSLADDSHGGPLSGRAPSALKARTTGDGNDPAGRPWAATRAAPMSGETENWEPGTETPALAGSGLDSMLRLAASDERLWVEILGYNRDHVIPALHDFIGRLQDLSTRLSSEDANELEDLLRRAREAVS